MEQWQLDCHLCVVEGESKTSIGLCKDAYVGNTDGYIRLYSLNTWQGLSCWQLDRTAWQKTVSLLVTGKKSV